MGGHTLLITPALCGVDEVEVFAGTNVLVLDELLMSGVAGLVFRRFRVSAALHPAVRSEFDRKRHAYLKSVLPALVADRSDVVVVGTHPTDVDLLDFETVAAVKVSDLGMRDLSKLVYGDALMLHAEYLSVLRSIGDAVDVWFNVVHWREITMLTMRQFPVRAVVDVALSHVRQRQVLSSVLSDQADVSVWLEDEIQLDTRNRKGFLIADYDYLSVVRPRWRDAVVRLLGAAPAIDVVFRLPWYVVDPVSLHTLCFRSNAAGKPAASMRGRSLVDFVRVKLAASFTTRELVGTWVGSLLNDNITAVDTVLALGTDSLAPTIASECRSGVALEYAVKVPPEYLWMYEAVPDVVSTDWVGLRHVDGKPMVRSVTASWPFTLPLAEVYHEYEHTVSMRAEVVRAMYRYHTMDCSAEVMGSIVRHAVAIHDAGPTAELFDSGLTVLLPGYTYLSCYSSMMRLKAVGQMGCDPSLSVMVDYARRVSSVDGLVSVEEVFAEASRSMLFAGRVWHAEVGELRVGSRLLTMVPGYCYECLFVPVHRARIRRLLGPYPTFHEVMDWRYMPWWIDGAIDQVHIVPGAYTEKQVYNDPVMHFTLQCEGLTLRVYMDQLWSKPPAVRHVMSDVRVGDTGSCQQIFVANIIAWTIVSVAVVVFIGYLIYLRCSGGKSRYGGNGGYGRR